MAKLSVYQQTVDKLQAKILSGEWQPGQRLPTMKQLSKQMGVSITSMREALKSMENQNVISIEHGRGIYVRNDPNSVNAMGTLKSKACHCYHYFKLDCWWNPNRHITVLRTLIQPLFKGCRICLNEWTRRCALVEIS